MVKGILIVGGKTEPLRFAAAVAEPDQEHPKKEGIRVLLTNVPVPPHVVESTSSFLHYRQYQETQKELWGVLFELRPPEKRMAFLAVIHPVWGETLSPVLESQPQKLTLTTYTANRIAGRLSMTQDATFAFPPQDQPDATSPPYRFEAAFDVPIRRLPRPQLLTGNTARNCPPAKALAGFLDAIRRRDQDAINRYLAPPIRVTDSGFSAFLQMVEQVKIGQLNRVFLSGKRATVEFKPDKDQIISVEMSFVDGQWKVGG